MGNHTMYSYLHVCYIIYIFTCMAGIVEISYLGIVLNSCGYHILYNLLYAGIGLFHISYIPRGILYIHLLSLLFSEPYHPCTVYNLHTTHTIHIHMGRIVYSISSPPTILCTSISLYYAYYAYSFPSILF